MAKKRPTDAATPADAAAEPEPVPAPADESPPPVEDETPAAEPEPQTYRYHVRNAFVQVTGELVAPSAEAAAAAVRSWLTNGLTVEE